jgi:hypothetical protein
MSKEPAVFSISARVGHAVCPKHSFGDYIFAVAKIVCQCYPEVFHSSSSSSSTKKLDTWFCRYLTLPLKVAVKLPVLYAMKHIHSSKRAICKWLLAVSLFSFELMLDHLMGLSNEETGGIFGNQRRQASLTMKAE